MHHSAFKPLSPPPSPHLVLFIQPRVVHRTHSYRSHGTEQWSCHALMGRGMFLGVVRWGFFVPKEGFGEGGFGKGDGNGNGNGNEQGRQIEAGWVRRGGSGCKVVSGYCKEKLYSTKRWCLRTGCERWLIFENFRRRGVECSCWRFWVGD